MYRCRRSIYSCLIAFYLIVAFGISLLFFQSSMRIRKIISPEDESQQQQPIAMAQSSHQLSPTPLFSSIYDMPKRKPYRRRLSMGHCPPAFGRIMVLVLVEKISMPLTKNYGIAQNSLECYIRDTNYTLKRVDLDEDERSKKYCGNYKNLFFRKHCIASHYLVDTDWMVVLDADTGVVNPNHCIEEWIDERVDILFYERFFNWEIMSGNYLIKNTQFARKFLIDWANMEFWQPFFSSADNGALQLHILKTVLPSAKIEIKTCETYWNRSRDYDTLMAYTTCVRSALGAQRIWPPKLRIMRRAHGFARDWFMTDDCFTEADFMFHGWKEHFISQDKPSPFIRVPDPKECTGEYKGWHWRIGKRISVPIAKQMMAEQERHHQSEFPQKARIHGHLSEPDVAECYPQCDSHI